MNKFLSDAKASGFDLEWDDEGGASIYATKANRNITKELAKFAELVASTVPDADLLKELEALNRYMREKGLGQGEIDSISSLYDEIDELKLQAASTVPDDVARTEPVGEYLNGDIILYKEDDFGNSIEFNNGDKVRKC